MLSSKEELEGGLRLGAVRRVKRLLYITQVLVLILAIFVVILAEGRASLNPFYLPINSFLYFVLLMMLIISVEAMVFMVLEMRLLKSNSTKYYMAKRSTRRSIIIIIVAVVIALLFLTPYFDNAVEDGLAMRGTLTNTHTVAASSNVTFYDRDNFGLRQVTKVTVTSTGGEARVYLVSERYMKLYYANVSQLIQYRINTYAYVANNTMEYNTGELQAGKYFLVLDTLRSDASSVSFQVTSTMSSTFLGFVPLFAILFAVVNVGWIIYLTPSTRKYSKGAIYK